MQTCPSCNSAVIPGALFCESCGATLGQVQAARKLRKKAFTSVVAAPSTGGLLEPGQIIRGRDSYIIEESIAKSGFGATFRALRLEDDKQILIKQMLDQASYDQFRNQLIRSFRREAKFLSSIRHPAFPRGYEYFQKGKSIYLVMDFINGRELAKALSDYRTQNGKVEDGLVVYLGIEIADALQKLHDHGYIYRDLKPQNVMLDGVSSKVKLIDFGTLYHPSDPNPLLFESEGYTPPDFLEKGRTFQPSGDIYGLGALMYEALVGQTPEFGKLGGLDGVSSDERLKKIIRTALAEKPEDRFQTASRLRDELRALTRSSIWPFSNGKRIPLVELSVLPKTLYPAGCTFCDICGHSDPSSQTGYCPTCRVPLKVARLRATKPQRGVAAKEEYFLNSGESVLGSGQQADFTLKNATEIDAKHFKVVRKGTKLWLESFPNTRVPTRLNKREIIGPVELMSGDVIEVGKSAFAFGLKDAC